MPHMTQHHELGSREHYGKLTTAHLFAAFTILATTLADWPLRWLLSGAPLLTYSILLGESNGYRILPVFGTWALLATLNLVYAVAATSWLLYWFFAAGCYPMIFISCLFQFDAVADFVRRRLRAVLRGFQFTNDKVAFFDLPALEIDTDVEGLFVVRGITISLSSLTVLAHGIEVGIKLSDDMEIALQVDRVEVSFFRKIEIGDVYGSLKGGELEMTFGNLGSDTHDADGDPVMTSDTPLLRAATLSQNDISEAPAVKMTDEMTGGRGRSPEPSSVRNVMKDVRQLSADDEEAREQYESAIEAIERTSTISEARRAVEQQLEAESTAGGVDKSDPKQMRAAICSQLHSEPSIPHPPRRSVRVTTLQNLSPPYVRRFMHRLPMLLRLLLNPLSYFHPVRIASITAAGSGAWIRQSLKAVLFQDWGENDLPIRGLEKRIFAWLADANFVVQLANIAGDAQVPFLTGFDIEAAMNFDDIVVHRALAHGTRKLLQVVRLGGADASASLPAFLLPHHEHLLPARPTRREESERRADVAGADGIPKKVQAERSLLQTERDETAMSVSAHLRLPAWFDAELLAFASALVKATKVIEMEKEPSPMEREVGGVKDFARAVHAGAKDGLKRTAVDGLAKDRWIAKLVHKVTLKLETARGNVGYSGEVPIALAPYREAAEPAGKLLG